MPGFAKSSVVRVVNDVATRLINAPVVGGLIRRGLVTIRYVGRRSGKTFELPVGYRRRGDTIVIGVSMPDGKAWWRNFLGDGEPIVLVGFDGRDQTGHAVAQRDDRGRVSVTVTLTER
jgi:F420H(2)-dependent quinone reductase